mmetsp:Transcript_74821/g.141073  ORF Transcript_74821/g.141073 Transcript_74821/m.141073 type:complete len:174 (-) Transcript_74821:574-1095(-)
MMDRQTEGIEQIDRELGRTANQKTCRFADPQRAAEEVEQKKEEEEDQEEEAGDQKEDEEEDQEEDREEEAAEEREWRRAEERELSEESGSAWSAPPSHPARAHRRLHLNARWVCQSACPQTVVKAALLKAEQSFRRMPRYWLANVTSRAWGIAAGVFASGAQRHVPPAVPGFS